MKKKEIRQALLICILLCNIPSFIYGQSLKAQVVDELEQPIEYANAILLSLPDSAFIKGTITDENGFFCLEDIKNEKQILQVSFLGYNTVNILCTPGDMNRIILKPSSIVLKETVVVGHQPTYKLEGTNLVANIKNSILSKLGFASDVLANIPGLRTTNNGIEVFGKGAPIIYINNRKIENSTELMQLSSSEIEKIEVISDPGAEYDATVTAVVKIKTIKPVGEGLGGFFHVSEGRTDNWKHQAGTNLNYRRKGLDVFGSLYFISGINTQKTDGDLSIYSDTIWNISDKTNMPYHWKALVGKTGFNYIFNKKHFLGATYDISASPFRMNAVVSGKQSVYANDKLFDNLMPSWLLNRESRTHRINSYYNGVIGQKTNIDFNFDYVHDEKSDKQLADEKSEYQENRKVTSSGNANADLYAAKLIFTYPFKNGNINFGGEYNFINRNNTYLNHEQILPDTYNTTKEQKIAGFVNYSLSFGKSSVQLGARYEHANFKYLDKDGIQGDKSKKYNNLFPNVSISFPVKKGSIAFSYSAKTSRPTFGQLDGSIQYNNRYMYKQGNPMLQPQFVHNASSKFIYKYLLIQAGYTYTKDYICPVQTQYSDHSSISISSYQNFDKNQKINFSISISPKIKIWEPSWSLYYTQQFFKAEYQNRLKRFNNPLLGFSFNNQIRLPEGFIFILDMNYQSAGNSGIAKVESTEGVNVGLNKSLLNNTLFINLKVTDVFNTNCNITTTYSNYSVYKIETKRDTRGAMLSLTWLFNTSNNKYKGKGAANEDVNRL